MFDFLREVVSRVPDYGHGHSDAAGDDRTIPKRRLNSDSHCSRFPIDVIY